MSEPEVAPDSTEDALFSRIALFANPRKSEYLGYRACNFSVREACDLVPISLAQVHKWRREDPEFAKFESNNLHELQRDIGPQLLRLDFVRNVKLFLKIDFKVLYKAHLLGLDVGPAMGSKREAVSAGLTSREFEYLKTIRKEYGPAAMLAFHKALEPESVKEDRGMLDKVVVIVNNQIIEGEAARAAAGKVLLDQMKENRKMLPEGEVGGQEA